MGLRWIYEVYELTKEVITAFRWGITVEDRLRPDDRKELNSTRNDTAGNFLSRT
jgi:hypothetical protein